MSKAASDRWFGLSRKTVLIAATVMMGIVVLWALLALTSTVPYHWAWISHADTVTDIRLYWDGRSEISEHPRTTLTLVAECTIWSVLAAATAAAGYWAVRRLKRPAR
jgi:hypothetical protein